MSPKIIWAKAKKRAAAAEHAYKTKVMLRHADIALFGAVAGLAGPMP